MSVDDVVQGSVTVIAGIICLGLVAACCIISVAELDASSPRYTVLTSGDEYESEHGE